MHDPSSSQLGITSNQSDPSANKFYQVSSGSNYIHPAILHFLSSTINEAQNWLIFISIPDRSLATHRAWRQSTYSTHRTCSEGTRRAYQEVQSTYRIHQWWGGYSPSLKIFGASFEDHPDAFLSLKFGGKHGVEDEHPTRSFQSHFHWPHRAPENPTRLQRVIVFNENLVSTDKSWDRCLFTLVNQGGWSGRGDRQPAWAWKIQSDC